MKKRTINNLATGALVAVGIVGIVSFAAWRCEVNSPKETLATIIHSREAEEESIAESIRAEQTETESASILKLVAEYAERATVAEILQTQEATETQAETAPTETPTDATRATETNATPENVQIINEAQTEANKTVSLVLSPEDERLLLVTASCEAGNQGVVGIALVMRVILNRSSVYGMTIHDVIYAPRQFAVVGMPLFENGYISPDAPAALDAVKNGWDGSQGALFFCAPWANGWHSKAKQFLFQYGGHEFYK